MFCSAVNLGHISGETWSFQILFKSISTVMDEISKIICDRSGGRNFCHETLWLRSDTIGFVHEAYVGGIVQLFHDIQINPI